MKLPALRIRDRIVLLVGGVLLFSGVVSALLIESRTRRLLRHQFLTSFTAETNDLAERAAEPVLTHSLSRVRELVESFQSGHEMTRYVFVIGPTGAVLASSFGRGVPREIVGANRPRTDGTPRVQVIATEDGPVHDIAAWILEGNAGMVRVGLAESAVERLTEPAQSIVLTVQVAALVAALGVAFVLASVLVAPLRRLGAAAHRVARGDLDTEVQIESSSEVGEVGAAFNRMLRELRTLRDEIVAARDAAVDLLRSLPDALLSTDVDGKVIAVNPATERLSGFSESALMGRPIEHLLEQHGDTPLASLLSRDGTTASYDLRIRCADGPARPVSFRAAPLCARDGTLRGFVLTLRDLGQLRWALERMREERDDLEHRVMDLRRVASRRDQQIEDIRTHLVRSDRLVSLGQLAAGIAHEINNPLAGILTYSRVLDRSVRDEIPNPSEPIIKALRVIETQVQRCSDIVGRLLGYARAGQRGAETVNVDQLLDEVLTLVEPQARVQQVTLDRDRSSIPLICVGDAGQLHQAVLNVLLNAMQATPSGGKISISATQVESSDGAPPMIQVLIRDTGCGIPPENLPHIFDPFFTTKKPGEGTGLGLAVAHDILVAHRGTIDVTSEVGRGTEIVLRIPTDGRGGP